MSRSETPKPQEDNSHGSNNLHGSAAHSTPSKRLKRSLSNQILDELREKENTTQLIIENKIGSGGEGDVYYAILIIEEPGKPRKEYRVAAKKLRVDNKTDSDTFNTTPNQIFNTPANQSSSKENQWTNTQIAAATSPSSAAETGLSKFLGEMKGSDGESYTVFRLCEFGSLNDFINPIRRLKTNNTALYQHLLLRILRNLLRAYERLTKKSVLHRDIKPDNTGLIADEEGRLQAVLLDFGSAVQCENEAETKQGFTIEYAAPEIIITNTAYHKSDLYSIMKIIARLVPEYDAFFPSLLSKNPIFRIFEAGKLFANKIESLGKNFNPPVIIGSDYEYSYLLKSLKAADKEERECIGELLEKIEKASDFEDLLKIIVDACVDQPLYWRRPDHSILSKGYEKLCKLAEKPENSAQLEKDITGFFQSHSKLSRSRTSSKKGFFSQSRRSATTPSRHPCLSSTNAHAPDGQSQSL